MINQSLNRYARKSFTILPSYTMLRKWQWVFQRLNDYSDFSWKQTDIFFSQTCPTASCNKCLTPSSCWCRTPASCPATSPTTSSTRSPPSSPSSGPCSQVRIFYCIIPYIQERGGNTWFEFLNLVDRVPAQSAVTVIWSNWIGNLMQTSWSWSSHI